MTTVTIKKPMPKRNKDGKFKSKRQHPLTKNPFVATGMFGGPALPQNILTGLALLHEMKASKVFGQEELKKLYLSLYEGYQESQLKFPGTHTGRMSSSGETYSNRPKDATQLVPVSNVQASSLTPNFESVRGFFLTGRQKHPDFKEYIPAEEIGEQVGMKADNVKFFIKKYCEGLGCELPNNDARQAVINDGGYFKGMSKRLDSNNLPLQVNEKVEGIGCWYMMEDGQMVWRNYWSPTAVKAIIALIPEDKKHTYVRPTEQLNPFSTLDASQVAPKLSGADQENIKNLGYAPKTRVPTEEGVDVPKQLS